MTVKEGEKDKNDGMNELESKYQERERERERGGGNETKKEIRDEK